MLEKITTSLTPDYHKLTTSQVFFILFASAFFIRFPFFFRDYIDLDESTFILMGQSWVDGHLPYTELWDLKPPLVFLFFAGIIAIFGKSFIAIRLAGTLVVSIGALSLYKIGRLTGGGKTGFWSAVFFVLLSSLFGSVQGVMSEHLSTTFFLAGIYPLLYTSRLPLFKILLAGVLLGSAFMTKLNLSYAILLVGLVICIQLFKEQGLKEALGHGLVLGTGVVLPAVLLYSLYAFNGSGGVWWESVIEASFAYGRIPFSERWDTVLPILLILLFLVLFVRWNAKKKGIPSIWQLSVLIASSLGILFSFFQVGKVNGHYLIQLYPFLLVLLFAFLFQLPVFSSKIASKIALVLFILIPLESYLEYRAVLHQYLKKNTFYNGEGIEVPEYLKTNFPEEDNIWFLEFHVGYWLLDQKPPTRATTHPSNLMRAELFPYMQNPRKTSLEELKYILIQKAPELIVTRGERIPFNADNKEEVYAYFAHYLKANYRFVKQIGKATIYERL